MKHKRLSSIIASVLAIILLAIAAPAGAYSDYSLIYEKEGNDKVLTGYVGPLPDRVDIANGTTIIGEEALANNKEFDAITFPDSVREIREKAVYDTSLDGVLRLSADLETIGAQAFAYNHIQEIYLYGNVQEIDPTAFTACTSVQGINFSGTRDQWDQLNFRIPTMPGFPDYTGYFVSGRDFFIQPDEGGAHTATANWSQEILVASQAVPDVTQLNLTISKDSGYTCEDGHQLSVLSGLLASGETLPISELIGNLCTNGTLEYYCPHGDTHHQVATTGDRFILKDSRNDEVMDEAVILMRGDVLGTGQMSLSQLVRMAQAVNGSEPLEGVYADAADLTGDGLLGIGDLVEAARLLESIESYA